MKSNEMIVCSPQLGISQDTNSGGEVYDREVLKGLANIGVEIEIILPKGRSYERGISNWHVTYLPVGRIFPPYLFNLFIFPFLFKVFKSKKFDLLRVHSPYFVGLAALAFKLFNKVPIVASYLHLEDKNLIFTIIDKLIINRFDHIVTISESTKNEITRKYSTPLEKITVSYPGLDLKFKSRPKDKKLLKELNLRGKKILLYLGGLKFRKNVSFLLDLIKNLDPDVVLVIGGEGISKAFLKLKAVFLGISDRVKFIGYVPESQKVDFYNLCDVFLVPSKKEGFGMISTEAQACGKPVLVSESSSLPETLIDGETGFICKNNNKKDWEEKIRLLLSNDKLRISMSRKATEFAKSRFSWEKSAKIQKEVFKRLIG